VTRGGPSAHSVVVVIRGQNALPIHRLQEIPRAVRWPRTLDLVHHGPPRADPRCPLSSRVHRFGRRVSNGERLPRTLGLRRSGRPWTRGYTRSRTTRPSSRWPARSGLAQPLLPSIGTGGAIFGEWTRRPGKTLASSDHEGSCPTCPPAPPESGGCFAQLPGARRTSVGSTPTRVRWSRSSTWWTSMPAHSFQHLPPQSIQSRSSEHCGMTSRERCAWGDRPRVQQGNDAGGRRIRRGSTRGHIPQERGDRPLPLRPSVPNSASGTGNGSGPMMACT
jgi:hypothetical protein